MTKLLKRAFAEASKLSSEEQDVLASRLLEELTREDAFDRSIAQTAHQLKRLAEEALSEHEAGLTEELNPDRF